MRWEFRHHLVHVLQTLNSRRKTVGLLFSTPVYLFFCTIARKNKIKIASVIEDVITEP
jgi:hypothetical protein